MLSVCLTISRFTYFRQLLFCITVYNWFKINIGVFWLKMCDFEVDRIFEWLNIDLHETNDDIIKFKSTKIASRNNLLITCLVQLRLSYNWFYGAMDGRKLGANRRCIKNGHMRKRRNNECGCKWERVNEWSIKVWVIQLNEHSLLTLYNLTSWNKKLSKSFIQMEKSSEKTLIK